jgi:hypothetical protein
LPIVIRVEPSLQGGTNGLHPFSQLRLGQHLLFHAVTVPYFVSIRVDYLPISGTFSGIPVAYLSGVRLFSHQGAGD